MESSSGRASRQRLPERLEHPGRGSLACRFSTARALAEGYAIFSNTLNHPTNSCNAFLAGETTMMGKEHFIETFGVPRYTVTTGGIGRRLHEPAGRRCASRDSSTASISAPRSRMRSRSRFRARRASVDALFRKPYPAGASLIDAAGRDQRLPGA